jgi:hypothetical protein
VLLTVLVGLVLYAVFERRDWIWRRGRQERRQIAAEA